MQINECTTISVTCVALSILEPYQESFKVSRHMDGSYIHDLVCSDDGVLLPKLSRTAVYGYCIPSTLSKAASRSNRTSNHIHSIYAHECKVFSLYILLFGDVNMNNIQNDGSVS